MKVVCQVVHVVFTGDKKTLPYDYVINAEKWLEQWEPREAIPRAIGAKQDCVETFRQYMLSYVFESTHLPEHFSFYIGYSEIKDGMFWPPTIRKGRAYKMVEKEKGESSE